MLVAARDAGVERFVYAASSSAYGDHPGAAEGRGRDRPAAVAVRGRPSTSNELYADVFGRCYGMADDRPALLQRVRPAPGSRRRLRRGDPALDRARCCAASRARSTATARRARDFCYVDNVVQANLLAATVEDPRRSARSTTSRSASGRRSTSCYAMLRDLIARAASGTRIPGPAIRRIFAPATSATRRPTSAKARRLLGYRSRRGTRARGLANALPWYENGCIRSLNRSVYGQCRRAV